MTSTRGVSEERHLEVANRQNCKVPTLIPLGMAPRGKLQLVGTVGSVGPVDRAGKLVKNIIDTKHIIDMITCVDCDTMKGVLQCYNV